MSIRTFLFRDIGNPQGLRTTMAFRRAPRGSERAGRRIGDGEAWFDGELKAAVEAGGLLIREGQHICPVCQTANHWRQFSAPNMGIRAFAALSVRRCDYA